MPIIQLTGLSGSGKTTLSLYVKQKSEVQNLRVEIIDGDVYRKTLCSDLGFSKEDRCENIRRLGKAAHALSKKFDVVIIAAINPYEQIRKELKTTYDVKTVWINCDIDVLIKRDTKGLYQRALLSADHPDKLNNLTGVNDGYDVPIDYDMVINTHAEGIEQSGNLFYNYIASLIMR
jgi:adenylylsulfate kinase